MTTINALRHGENVAKTQTMRIVMMTITNAVKALNVANRHLVGKEPGALSKDWKVRCMNVQKTKTVMLNQAQGVRTNKKCLKLRTFLKCRPQTKRVINQVPVVIAQP